MPLQFYNTLGRKKEPFVPVEKGKIGIYSCGPTVYNYVHIGNLRAYVFVDLLKRYLAFKGFALHHIMNITDVDDKTIRESQKVGKTLKEFTEYYTAAFLEDITALNIKLPDIIPRATEAIPEMVALIKQMHEKGAAYERNGTWYCRISAVDAYGKLACLHGAELKQNADGRMQDADEYEKDDVRDFALWKAWDKEDGTVFWETELGKGRPGWHIECSAMSMCHLGETYDIHGGGQDLVFPHHENEIAQSEGATGKPYVKYWLHNGFVNINNEKMSKSLGNFFTIRDLLQKYNPEVLRFYILSSQHYRSPINFSDDQLEESAKRLDRLYQPIWSNLDKGQEIELSKDYQLEFEKYMDDDFNAAGAIGILFQLANETNKLGSSIGAILLKKLGGILGLLQQESATEETPTEIIDLLELRATAKKSKNWEEADRIRDLIIAKGFEIKDTPQGSAVKKIG